MPKYSVILTEQDEEMIDASIAAGRFSDASEVLSAGLHLLGREEAEDRAKIEWLRNAALEGIASLDRGDYVTLHSDEDIDALVRSAGNARP